MVGSTAMLMRMILVGFGDCSCGKCGEVYLSLLRARPFIKRLNPNLKGPPPPLPWNIVREVNRRLYLQGYRAQDPLLIHRWDAPFFEQMSEKLHQRLQHRSARSR